MAVSHTIVLQPHSENEFTYSNSHFQDAFSKIDNMRRTGSLLCDVTVVFGNGNHIKAHKLILASSSKFFRTLFVDPTLGFSSIVKVQDASEEVGHLLVEFAYTAQLSITEENVVEILKGAEKLGFEQVECLCIEAIRTKFDLNRVQGIDLPNLLTLLNRYGQQVTQKVVERSSPSLSEDAMTSEVDTTGNVAIPSRIPGSAASACATPVLNLPSDQLSAVETILSFRAPAESSSPLLSSLASMPPRSTIGKAGPTAEPVPRQTSPPKPDPEQSHPQTVSVSLTPGYIVLMTPSGTIRKIKVSEDLIDEEPEVLQLRLGASASLLDETHGSGVTEAPSVPTKVVTETQDKKKKKKTKAKDSKNERQISEFDRKLDVLSKFEDRLTDKSLTSMENWQKEPLKRRRVICALCPIMITGSYHDLMEHVWQEHGPKPPGHSVPGAGPRRVEASEGYDCRSCGKKYLNRNDLQVHVRNLHVGETLDCEFCDRKGFANRRNLRNHQAICEHNVNGCKREQFHCIRCSKSFSHQWSLKNHMNHVHEKGPKVNCPTCHKSFVTKTVLDSHVRMVHLGEKEVPKPCPDCGKLYTMRALREHRKRDHQGLRYACPDCGIQNLFTTKIMLARHREVVHQKRRFRCTLCQAEFVDRSAWKLHHEAEHVGKRYPCPQCLKQFKRPGDVRRHIKEVHQGCRYTCQYCEKSFSQQAKLKLHIRSFHMGNYPHTCSVCAKGFLRPSTLKVHMLKQHQMEIETNPTEALMVVRQAIPIQQT